ncbi:MAG: hypothetical protein Q8M73_11165 [Actinomycetota bacterium]|nr:hypothetical protein [Actinomycetota bacterium]
MIAIIVLVALALIVGLVVSFVALVVVIVKAVFRTSRSSPLETPAFTAGENQEFLHIVQSEWPASP